MATSRTSPARLGRCISERTVARGACFADYENDGKVGAFVVNLGAKGTLLHNVSTNTGHWVEIKLIGSKSNRDGIGARVEVLAGGKRWTAERVASSGYLSQNDSTATLWARLRPSQLTKLWFVGRAGPCKLWLHSRSTACLLCEEPGERNPR